MSGDPSHVCAVGRPAGDVGGEGQGGRRGEGLRKARRPPYRTSSSAASASSITCRWAGIRPPRPSDAGQRLAQEPTSVAAASLLPDVEPSGAALPLEAAAPRWPPPWLRHPVAERHWRSQMEPASRMKILLQQPGGRRPPQDINQTAKIFSAVVDEWKGSEWWVFNI